MNDCVISDLGVYRDIERRSSSMREGNRNGREGSSKVHIGSLIGHGGDLGGPGLKGFCRANRRGRVKSGRNVSRL